MAAMRGRPLDLVLASASPRRRELLAAVGLAFRVVPADLDEAAIGRDLPPEAAALTVAAAKAVAVADRGAVVLAADTIVVLDGRMLGKPGSADEAGDMLRELRGRTHEVVTGVAVQGDGEHLAVRWSAVRMRAYGVDEIDAYVAAGGGLDKAGAYGIQDEPFRPVAAIEGCWCNVMGLPLWTAVRLLDLAGCDVPGRPDHAFARCASCPLAGAEPT